MANFYCSSDGSSTGCVLYIDIANCAEIGEFDCSPSPTPAPAAAPTPPPAAPTPPPAAPTPPPVTPPPVTPPPVTPPPVTPPPVTPAPTAPPTLPPIAPLPSTNLSISGVVVHKGGSLVAGNYSLSVISQDGDSNSTPNSINPNSTSKPDKTAPHGLGEFVNYNHNTGR